MRVRSHRQPKLANMGTPRKYRSGSTGDKKRSREESFAEDSLEESLDLLSESDFSTLAHQRARHIRGTLSWARLAEGASRS